MNDAETQELLDKIVQNNKMDRFMRDKHKQFRRLLAGHDWLRRFQFRADVTSSDFHSRCVTFNRFQNEIWGCHEGILSKLRSKHEVKHVDQLSPIIVFSNIRTFIKGGLRHAREPIDPEQGLLPLSKEEYLEVHDNDCDVPEHLRELIYKAYLHYDDYMKQHMLWDDADLDADVYAMLAYICQQSRLSVAHASMLANHHHLTFESSEHDSAAPPAQTLSYDRIYVDECQDMSPVQIAILILSCNDLQNGLFFAGDTAQSVANGVYFRFEEVNTIVWDLKSHHPDRRLCDKQLHFEKAKLRCNFRSHDGVLRVCDQIIKLLSKAFPKGTTTVNSWMEYVSFLPRSIRASHLFAGTDQRTATQLVLLFNTGACCYQDDEQSKSKSFGVG
jgi:superfamily I DNA/RNA helicase